MKSKPVQATVYVSTQTIHDKDSMFRAKRPNIYLVSIHIRTNGRNVIVREISCANYKEQMREYKRLREYFV